MSQEQVNRKLSCILSTDVVGYSRLMEENEASTVRYLEENKKLITKLIEECNGRVVDSPGDNLLAEFSSAVKAVDCAVKIQKELKIKNADLVENKRMQFRIGINLGDLIEEDGRLYGSGVNIAARLEGLAEPGGICISRNVYDQVKTKLDLNYEYLGENNVKNISEPVWVYRVHTGVVTAESDDNIKVNTKFSYKMAIVLILIIIAGFIIWRFYPNQRIGTEQAAIETKQKPANREVKETLKTIAVLPFVNLSSDPEQEYFVDGLSEETINRLSQIPNLGVIGRTSSFTFKGSNKKTQEIANELGVDHILEGSVRKAGNSLRITAQLIRASDGLHLWSETYDRKLDDIFNIQKDIADNVAKKLKLTLDAFSSIGGTDNIKAYELYLTAKGLNSALPLIDNINQQLKLLEEATNLDPDFASAWALKSTVHVKASVILIDRAYTDELDKGFKAATKAIDLEPRLGNAYLSLGLVYTKRNEFIKAGSAYMKGMAYTKKSTDYGEYMLTLHYADVGYLEKGVEILEELWRNDPLKTDIGYFYILNLILVRDIKRAEQEYEKLIKNLKDLPYINELKKDIISILILNYDSSLTFYANEDIEEYPDIVELLKAKESPEEMLSELHISYNNDNLDFMSIEVISIKAAYLGDPEFALEAMERSYRLNNPNIWCIWLPSFKNVRQLPRFKEFISEIGLVDYWKEFGWPDLCRPLGDSDFICD